MRSPHVTPSRARRWFAISALAIVTMFAASSGLNAQRPAADGRPALYGGWTIDREASSTGPSPDGRAGDRGPGGPPPGGMPGGGGFGGPGGGRGGFGGGGFGGGRGGGRGMDREEMDKMRALMQDFMTPTARWLIVAGDGDIVVFTDGDGRTTRYAVNDKKEKHQLLAGTIETKTKWDGGELRQEIELRDGMKAIRTYGLDDDQLVVTTTMEGGRSPGGGRRGAPVRWVYDRDVVQQ